MNFSKKPALFRSKPSEVSKKLRLKFIAVKTDGGRIKGNISFYCRILKVSREAFRKYLINKDKPWKYKALADEMRKIKEEDECNDTYGRIRMYQALKLKSPKNIHIPSERTVYRIGSQYTSKIYRSKLNKYGIVQSMNSDGGRCHDNARCESMWARMKTELLYGRYDTEHMTTEELKVIIWRYFISYWNNRRICTANGGLPPMVKRQRYYNSLDMTA